MEYDDRYDKMDLGAIVPDSIPQWLIDKVKGAGRTLGDLPGIEAMFNATDDAIKANKFDRTHFRSMRDQSEDLLNLATARFVDDPAFHDLVMSEYLALFKPRPQLRKESELKPTHKIHAPLMKRVQELRDWQQLRTYTELDEWASAMAAVEFGMKLADMLDEMQELKEHQAAANEAARQAQALLDALQGTSDSQRASELLDQLAEQLAKGQAAGEAAADEIESGGKDMRAELQSALESALDKTEGLSDMLDFFGTEPGALQRMNGQERMELAARILRSKKLQELASKIGRFVRLALGEQANKIVHAFDEVHDVRLSGDVARALPSEFLNLADDDLEGLFLERLANSKLLTYEMRGREKVAQGAIIAMIDSSGSMAGGQEAWAKAVAIALLHIAAKQKRDFYGIIFGSPNQMMEFHFPKGVASPSDVLDFAEFAFMGGTDFMTPIGRSVEVLEAQFNAEGSQKGDLVLITDGECYVTDEWLEAYFESKKRLAFRMYGCLIGFQSALVDQLSDVTYNILELADGGEVRTMFGYV